MVAGWQLADHMRTSLVTDALAMAITHGHVRPGAIFHSDKGAQYTSAEFARFCAARGIRTSTGKTGVCWDNAAAESFFGALKNEMYYRQSFPDRTRARFAAAGYIEVFYNRKRLHSALGYRTPSEALTDSRDHQQRLRWSEVVGWGGVEPPTFRFSGVADGQVISDQICESSRLSMAGSERWRLPSLPSRLPSQLPADLPLGRRRIRPDDVPGLRGGYDRPMHPHLR